MHLAWWAPGDVWNCWITILLTWNYYNTVLTLTGIKILKIKNGQRSDFFKEDMKMGNRHLKRYSISLIIRKMHIKTTNHLNCEWLKSKTQNTSVGEDVEKKESSWTLDGNANWYSHCGKQLKIELPYDPLIIILGIYSKHIRFANTYALLCLLQHYLQQPSYGSSPSVHQ